MAPSIDYHAMRMRWCRAALWAFVRRWAVFMVAGAAVLVAGMPGGPAAAVTSIQGVCAWLVLPLFQAVVEPVWIVPAIVLQALVGAGLVWGMRPLLWPVRWAAAERALPIAWRDAWRSDCRVVPLGLLPWMLPCVLGAHALLARNPAWLQPVRGRALVALVCALAGSIGLGVAMLQWLRRAPSAGRTPRLPTAHGPSAVRAFATPPVAARAAWCRAVLWWPLRRGPARRSGKSLAAGALLLCTPAIGLLRWPSGAGWWLAAYALGALVVVTRLNGLARLEFQALLQACAPLPLAPRTLQRGREAIALAPLPVSGALLMTACLAHAGTRPGVLAAYAATVAASCAFEVRSAAPDAAAKASRWMFCVALMWALGSEVWP